MYDPIHVFEGQPDLICNPTRAQTIFKIFFGKNKNKIKIILV